MLDIIKASDKQKYTVSFAAGEVLFLQGDDSKDMYILVSGHLDVYKENKKIAEIVGPGTTVGEISFMLKSRRTATIKALTDVKIILIPSGQIVDFMRNYPTLAHHVSLTLARRLEETSRILHGLREFSDQLPDAIVMTDKDTNILSWNQASEKLYGKSWQQMKGFPFADLYLNTQNYQQFIEDVQSGNSLRGKELDVKHPDGDESVVSISTTVLYDGHHNVDGFIFLSRDVTNIKDLERKYKRAKRWLIPSFVFLFLLIAALFFSIPHFSKGARILDYKKDAFKSRIIEDSKNMTTALTGPLANGYLEVIASIMRSYFENGNPEHFGINGLILLDREKKVIMAYSPRLQGESYSIIGTNYSSIKFRGEENSAYKTLTLFRADKANPMGAKGVEIAYEVRKDDDEITNWFIFQLEREHLNREYGINTKTLSKIKF